MHQGPDCENKEHIWTRRHQRRNADGMAIDDRLEQPENEERGNCGTITRAQVDKSRTARMASMICGGPAKLVVSEARRSRDIGFPAGLPKEATSDAAENP